MLSSINDYFVFLAQVVPVEWRKRYCDAITGGDLLEFKYILEICDDKIFFPIG